MIVAILAEYIETLIGNMGYILISRFFRYTKKKWKKGKRFFEIRDYQEYTCIQLKITLTRGCFTKN